MYSEDVQIGQYVLITGNKPNAIPLNMHAPSQSIRLKHFFDIGTHCQVHSRHPRLPNHYKLVNVDTKEHQSIHSDYFEPATNPKAYSNTLKKTAELPIL